MPNNYWALIGNLTIDYQYRYSMVKKYYDHLDEEYSDGLDVVSDCWGGPWTEEKLDTFEIGFIGDLSISMLLQVVGAGPGVT